MMEGFLDFISENLQKMNPPKAYYIYISKAVSEISYFQVPAQFIEGMYSDISLFTLFV